MKTLQDELRAALDGLDNARQALERAGQLEGDAFLLDALRIASADVELIRRRVRNVAKMVRPTRGGA